MLATQVDGAIEDLLQAERALDALRGMRRPRVDLQLGPELSRRRTALSALRADIEREPSLAECWQQFGTWRDGVGELLEQCFAYVEGALTREHAIASDLCALADALLDDLSGRSLVPWSRFTVLAAREYTDRLSRVVRVRFPEASVWSLPITAHEFGHHVAHTLPQARLRAAARLGSLRSNPTGSAYLAEHLADAFATWATGPSYLASCLYLRFDARTVDHDLPSHPSDLRRAYVMLRVLECMGEDGAGSADILRGRWSDALLSAGAATRQPASDVACGLDALAKELAATMCEELPPAVRYDGWQRTHALDQLLTESSSTADLPDGARPWDVLHAAWECRMARGTEPAVTPGVDALYQIRGLGTAARELCARAVRANGWGSA